MTGVMISGIEIMQAGKLDKTPAFRDLLFRGGYSNVVSSRITEQRFTHLDSVEVSLSFDSWYWTGRGFPGARRVWRSGLDIAA